MITISPNGWKRIWTAAFLILLLAACEGKARLDGPGRLRVDTEGLITDSRSGLQWAPDPGRRMTWSQAGRYASQGRWGGFPDWRLPTRAELRGLGTAGLDPVFKLSGCCAWSSEAEDSSSAWEFHFREGREYWLFINRHAQVLAVRSPD